MAERRNSPWTDEQIAMVIERYPHMTTQALADLMGRSARSIYGKARSLGIRKSAEFLASGQVGRFDGVRGWETRFAPGHTTWNKGMKGLDLGGKATRFLAGEMPHNTAEVGAYRLTKDGTLQRKVSMAKGNNIQRWRGVHELVWIAENGQVPHGHICVFRPGMRTATLEEITADKVECISWAENMRRNTRHNLPKELNDVIGLRAALVRKINNRMKANEQPNNQRSA